MLDKIPGSQTAFLPTINARGNIVNVDVILFSGIASLGSTCASTFGAAVASDAGLGSAVTMAHELAHT